MSSLQSGDQLDHYRIEGLAAQSCMSSVYRATDLRNGRAVAIKVPSFEVESDPLFYDRFQREEEIGRKLDHTGVIKGLGDENRSRVYMVMEWVEGRLLRHVLAENKKLSADRAVRITLGICEALEYIHRNGVVHRDLKPENVMVESEDRIKLFDFGIAGSVGMRRLTFGKLTREMGTPDYISPEQVKSKRGDARSDVYALGIMLYETLTGEVPFHGPNPLAIINDRLVNHPTPPRESAASPTHQETWVSGQTQRFVRVNDLCTSGARQPARYGEVSQGEGREINRARDRWGAQTLNPVRLGRPRSIVKSDGTRRDRLHL